MCNLLIICQSFLDVESFSDIWLGGVLSDASHVCFVLLFVYLFHSTGNECDVNMESSDADYESDWPSTIPNLSSLSPYTPDPDDRMTVQEMIALR